MAGEGLEPDHLVLDEWVLHQTKGILMQASRWDLVQVFDRLESVPYLPPAGEVPRAPGPRSKRVELEPSSIFAIAAALMEFANATAVPELHETGIELAKRWRSCAAALTARIADLAPQSDPAGA